MGEQQTLIVDTDTNPVGLVIGQRYQALAKALLEAPDPVVAIAHELGDHAGRLDALDALAGQIRHLEAQIVDVKGRA